jgi:hypothetical protein
MAQVNESTRLTTLSTILRGNLPTLVPPNFCTSHFSPDISMRPFGGAVDGSPFGNNVFRPMADVGGVRRVQKDAAEGHLEIRVCDGSKRGPDA